MFQYLLSNGLHVICYPIPHAYSISIALYATCGSINETAKNNGITHLMEHLHFRAMDGFSQDELYYKMEKMGSTLRATTYKDLLRFYIKVRPNHLMEAMTFFQSILTTRAWKQEAFEMEKRVVLNELYEKSAYEDIYDDIEELLWGEHPLSQKVIGTEKSLLAIQPEDITVYKERFFFSGGLRLIVTGALSEADMQLICRTFETLGINCKKEAQSMVPPKQFHRKPDLELIKNNWESVDVAIAFDVDMHMVSIQELKLLNTLIGGGDGAILQKRIREKLGLTSNIYSYIETYTVGSALVITCTVNQKNSIVVLQEIMKLLREAKCVIPQRDLETSMPFFTENLWYWYEDPELLNMQIGMEASFRNIDNFSVENEIRLYQNISSERLTEISNSIFQSKNASVVFMGEVDNALKKGATNTVMGLDEGM